MKSPGRRHDRRLAPRICPDPGSRLAVARIRPGSEVRILDLSRFGVLVEGELRLLPGSLVEIQVNVDQSAERTRGRVERCHVSALGSGPPQYRAALTFEPPLATLCPQGADDAGTRPSAAGRQPGPGQGPGAPLGPQSSFHSPSDVYLLPEARGDIGDLPGSDYPPGADSPVGSTPTARFSSEPTRSVRGIPLVHKASAGSRGREL